MVTSLTSVAKYCSASTLALPVVVIHSKKPSQNRLLSVL
ncbi:hypothetical protein RU98_GL000440 [Enterococcus caccae]|nr:hypothetical protein RU98_GL000440 [Enterococcus caccae]